MHSKIAEDVQNVQEIRCAILTHGGSGSDSTESDGTKSAAGMGMKSMANGNSALEAVVQATRSLEVDPRFNAGIGSELRADGKTMQLDASCMTSRGEFGSVGAVEGVQNPIDIAKGVLLHSPHILIVGDGARIFAKEHNIPMITLSFSDARKSSDSQEHSFCDTVGAVAFDGTMFAAALSSGGLGKSALGRIGDVPFPGCGLFCGPAGAVACTGDGEFIALKLLAREVYGMIEDNLSPSEATDKALNMFDVSVDVGLIVLTKNGFASKARDGMAWSHITEVR